MITDQAGSCETWTGTQGGANLTFTIQSRFMDVPEGWDEAACFISTRQLTDNPEVPPNYRVLSYAVYEDVVMGYFAGDQTEEDVNNLFDRYLVQSYQRASLGIQREL